MNLFLVRHGESLGNVRGGYWGRTDVPLTERGEQQAAEAARQLAAFLTPLPTATPSGQGKSRKPLVLYASPLQRAVRTAEIIAEHLRMALSLSDADGDIRIEIMSELSEIDFGDWEQLHYEEIAERFPEACQAWQEDWAHFTYPHGEGFQEFLARVQRGWQRICAERLEAGMADGSCILVAHGGTLKALRLIAEHRPTEDFWRISLPVGGVQMVHISDVLPL